MRPVGAILALQSIQATLRTALHILAEYSLCLVCTIHVRGPIFITGPEVQPGRQTTGCVPGIYVSAVNSKSARCIFPRIATNVNIVFSVVPHSCQSGMQCSHEPGEIHGTEKKHSERTECESISSLWK